MSDLFSLTPQTVEQIRAKLQAQEHAAKVAARRAAAPDPDEFRLSGSDRPVDLAIAAGQQELLP